MTGNLRLRFLQNLCLELRPLRVMLAQRIKVKLGWSEKHDLKFSHQIKDSKWVKTKENSIYSGVKESASCYSNSTRSKWLVTAVVHKQLSGTKDGEKQEAFHALFLLVPRQSQYVSEEMLLWLRVLPLPIKRKALNHYLRHLSFFWMSVTFFYACLLHDFFNKTNPYVSCPSLTSSVFHPKLPQRLAPQTMNIVSLWNKLSLPLLGWAFFFQPIWKEEISSWGKLNLERMLNR